jgi:hypothetical protein
LEALECLVGKKALIFAGVIFVGGLIYFNGQVADACTHGNCVHGWSSKYTQDEQNNSRMWFIGFPLFVFLVYQFFNINVKKTSKPSSSSNKATKYSSGITINMRDLIKKQWEKKYGLILNFNENSELSGAKQFTVDKRLSMKKLNLSVYELEERIKKKIEIDKQEEEKIKQEESTLLASLQKRQQESEKIAKEYQELVCSIEERTEDINENKARDAKDIKRKKTYERLDAFIQKQEEKE